MFIVSANVMDVTYNNSSRTTTFSFDQAYGHSIALHCMVTCHVFLSLSWNIAMSFCLSTNSQCSKENNFCGNTNFVLIL